MDNTTLGMFKFTPFPTELRPFLTEKEELYYGVLEKNAGTFCGHPINAIYSTTMCEDEIKSLLLEIASLRKQLGLVKRRHGKSRGSKK